MFYETTIHTLSIANALGFIAMTAISLMIPVMIAYIRNKISG